MKDTLFNQPIYSLYVISVLWIALFSLKLFDYLSRDMSHLMLPFENSQFHPLRNLMVEKTNEMQQFSDWSETFLLNIVVVSTILIISVTAMNVLALRDEEDRITDIALFVSIVIFTYSRAISMLT